MRNIVMGNVVPLKARIKELEKRLAAFEINSRPQAKPSRVTISRNCPECGLPYGVCDPEGVGHYRG